MWPIPIHVDPQRGDTFDELFDLVWENGLEAGSIPTRFLVWLRSAIGRLLGSERRDLGIPGSGERTVAERLTEDDRRRNRAPDETFIDTSVERLRLVYRFDDEALLELSNVTVAALLHLGWLDPPDGRSRAELAVYVKTRGAWSRAYMAAIGPFRRWIVYPSWTRHIVRLWSERHVGAPGRGAP